MSTTRRFHQLIAIVLSCSILTGCAATTGRITSPVPLEAQAAITDFARQLPPGTLVLVERQGGRRIRGTLIKVGSDTLTVQPRTRLPEPPLAIAVSEIVRLQPQSENGRSLAKAIAIGAAAGAGAALGFFLFLLAALD